LPEKHIASGKRSARLSAKLAAWKAPRLQPRVAISTVALEVPGLALLGRERQDRAPPVAVPDDGARRADGLRPKLGHHAAHPATSLSSSVSQGSSASRQAV